MNSDNRTQLQKKMDRSIVVIYVLGFIIFAISLFMILSGKI